MSLINKMLAALEKTKKDKDQTHKNVLSGIIPTIRKQNNTLRWKVAYWAIMLMLASAITWHYHHKIGAKVAKTIGTLQQACHLKKQQKNSSIAAVPIPTIKLQNITLEQKNNQTILDFILTATTPYYVEHGPDQQLFITLSNTGLLGNLPVSLENTFITALNTKQSNNNILTTIALIPGTKIDDLQLIATPEPHLHLVFSNQQLTSSTMTKTAAPIPPEQQAAEHYQEIQQLLAQNAIPETISRLHMFIGDFPDHLPARELLVSLLIQEGKLQKADTVLMVGLTNHQGYTPFIKLKAHILIKENNPETAIGLLQKYITATDDIEYLALLAALYLQQGNFIQAAELYNQLTKVQPQKASWWLGLGIALESAGKKNASKEAYQRAYNSSDTPFELRDFLDERIKK